MVCRARGGGVRGGGGGAAGLWWLHNHIKIIINHIK